jgi:nucleotide-binding universal stress UspA family protein
MFRSQSATGAALAPDAAFHVFERAVVAVDFSPASLAAARWAAAHVAPRSEVIVAHVIAAPRISAAAADIDRALLRAQLREAPALRGGLGGFAATLNVAAARTVVRVGQVSYWLSVLAAESDAKLVVLGRRLDAQRRGIGEPSVLERTTRRARSSVLVVPEGAVNSPRHVVAAVDHSATATRALACADGLARQLDCPLTVVHVASPTVEQYDRVIRSTRSRPALIAPTDAEPMIAEQAVAWITERLARLGAHDERRIRIAIGDPTREIIAHAERFDAPLIVVGKRGDDGAPESATGSVARELLARAPFPVLACA